MRDAEGFGDLDGLLEGGRGVGRRGISMLPDFLPLAVASGEGEGEAIGIVTLGAFHFPRDGLGGFDEGEDTASPVDKDTEVRRIVAAIMAPISVSPTRQMAFLPRWRNATVPAS